MYALIIDDDPLGRRVARINLELSGWTVREAIDGETGLAAARQAPPDLILLDVRMARQNGFQVASALLSEASTAAIPILFTTVLDRPAGMDDLAAAGIDLLVKPMDGKALVARAAALAEQGRDHAAIAAARTPRVRDILRRLEMI